MIKIGIIGAGRIGKVHGESISCYIKRAKIKAIADPYMNEETRLWAQDLGIQDIYTDYKKILEDKEIDAVLICSSTDTHSKIALEAIKAGKHIFCEKPIDHDVNKIKEVIKALEGSRVKFQVGFNRRFDHNFVAARKAVEEGKVGAINILKITSRDPAAPPLDYIKVSGGIFLDMTIHDFDMVRYISGAEVEEVFAMGDALTDKNIALAGDIDTAIITLKLSDGSLAVIDNCRRACYGYDQRLEIFGSKGRAFINNDTQTSLKIQNKDGVVGENPLYFFLERYMQAYVEEIRAFIEAIEEDKDVPVNVYDGLQPVLIGLAAQKSLKEKRAVKIEEIKQIYQLLP